MLLSAESLRELRYEGRARTRPMARAAVHAFPPLSTDDDGDDIVLTTTERQFVEAVFQPAGLVLQHYRGRPLRRRMPAVLRALRAPNLGFALESVLASEASAKTALNALLVGHTTLFRDSEVFDVLRTRVLPPFAHRSTPPRVWSVGCSSGEELLSVALLLAEREVLAHCRLRGSDCRPAAIAAARSLSHRSFDSLEEPFADLQPCLQLPSFQAALERIEWRREDVFTAPPDGVWDIILCRNLSIYFDPAASQRFWWRLAESLAPGGVLVTGKAERPPAALNLHRIVKCIYCLKEASA